ncbi:Uncharacterised protein [Vibrio cholerae]|nr:Uncharacterised protein [Vibrio cholerae]
MAGPYSIPSLVNSSPWCRRKCVREENGTKEPPMRCFTICGYLRVVMPNTSWCFLVITSIAWIMLPCSKNTSAKMPL